MPTCPKCGSSAFRPVGVGTETVETEVAQLIPKARILRWDRDASQEMDMDEIVLTHFRNHQYDILIGTQMIAKGLDFPQVTLVGLVLADVGLNLPDYRSAERTFQLITQVAGRAGRGVDPGKVVLQTYQPEQSVILAAVKQDYESFYQMELAHRRELGYPPFARLIRFETRDIDPDKSRQTALELAIKLRDWLDQDGILHAEIIGPAPCFFEKVRNQYRWQIILRGGDMLPVLKRHHEDLAICRVELDPLNLL
jgi:primosomal protein N' (replication factor Y)